MQKTVTARYNIVIAKPYTDRQGAEKTNWVKIGTAVQFSDGAIVQNIDALPTGNWWDGTCQLFQQERRAEQPRQQGGQQQDSRQHEGYNRGYQAQQSAFPPQQGYPPTAPVGDEPF